MLNIKNTTVWVTGLVCVGIFPQVSIVLGQDSMTTDASTISPATHTKFRQARPYSPYAGRSYPTRPLFGDQHLHTSWSRDADGGGTRISPDEAYRFARGEGVVSSTGQPVKLSCAFDWLAVPDILFV